MHSSTPYTVSFQYFHVCVWFRSRVKFVLAAIPDRKNGMYELFVHFLSLLVKFANLQYFLLAPFARPYRVTDEAFIAET